VKETVRIEEVQKGDIINGKEVVDVLRRAHAGFVRLTLRGGDTIGGYIGKLIEVEQRR